MPFSTRYPDLALHLWSSSSLPKRLPEWKPSLKLDHVEILYVYGLADDYKAFKKWLAENRRRQLVVLEDDLAVFKAFSEMPNAQEIIDHPQIHLKWVAHPKEWDLVLEQFAAKFSVDKVEVAAIKPYEKLPRFRKIKLSILRKSVLWYSVTAENIGGHLLHRNIIPNLRKIPRCFYPNKWKDKLKNVPVIICGAGPSLKKEAAALLKLRDKALIIGCGSALSALSHLGIRPHLGMAIDPNAREFDCLKGCAYRDLPLLFGARLHPKVFELFDGPYGYLRSGSSSALETYIEEKLGLTDPGLGYDLGREALSVTTLALSFAHHCGCNPIIFAGVDLAYEKKQHYAEGVLAAATLDEKTAGERRLRRKNKKGEFVSTLTKWVMEQATIDTYAKNHPATTFYNASSGLGFKNIQDRPLEKIDLSSGKKYDIQRLIRETPTNVSSQQVEAVFKPLEKSLENCLGLFRRLQHAEGGKAVLYEYDLDEEPAYQLLLRAPRRDFERLQTASSEEKWNYLLEAASAYLSAMRYSAEIDRHHPSTF